MLTRNENRAHVNRRNLLVLLMILAGVIALTSPTLVAPKYFCARPSAYKHYRSTKTEWKRLRTLFL